MEIERILLDSWNVYKKNWKKLGLAVFIYQLIYFILYYLVYTIFNFSVYVGIISYIIFLVFGLILYGGLLYIFNLSFNKKFNISSLFDFSFKNWSKILAICILQGIIFLCIFSPTIILFIFYYFTDSIIYLILSVPLLIISFFISILFIFPLFSFVIEKLSIFDCIKRSLFIAKNNYGSLLLLLLFLLIFIFISSILILPLLVLSLFLLILLPFAILLIIFYLFFFLYPLIYLSLISFYRHAIKSKKTKF